MSTELWIKIIIALIGSGGIGSLLTLIWKNKRTVRADTIQEWKDVTTRLEKQIRRQELQQDRSDAVIRQHQAIVEVMWRSDGFLRAELVHRTAWVNFLYEKAKYMQAQLHELGKEVDGLKEPPPMKEIPPSADTEFMLRQAAQSAALVKEASVIVKDAGAQ